MESLQQRRITCQRLLQTELGQKRGWAAPQPKPFQAKTSTVSLAVWLREEGASAGSASRSGCRPLTPGQHREPRLAGSGHPPSFCGLRRCHQSAAGEPPSGEKPQPQRGQQRTEERSFSLKPNTELLHVVSILSAVYPDRAWHGKCSSPSARATSCGVTLLSA